MKYEYKTVGAPEKGKRAKGARTGSDKAAAAFDEVLQAEARDGWEYQRTDILPVAERKSWFGRSRQEHRAVMVFRREVEQVRVKTPARSEGEPQLRAVPSAAAGPREPTISDDPDLRLAEIVRGPGSTKSDER